MGKKEDGEEKMETSEEEEDKEEEEEGGGLKSLMEGEDKLEEYASMAAKVGGNYIIGHLMT